MNSDVIVTIDDVRAVGLCVNGSRAWFERHALDFRAFLRDGLGRVNTNLQTRWAS